MNADFRNSAGNGRHSPARFTFECIFLLAVPILIACDKSTKNPPPAVSAALVEEKGGVYMAVRNTSAGEFSICTDNVYDAVACLDVRRFPDTAELPPERVFGRSPAAPKRPIISVSDYVLLAPDQEIRLPVNLRCIPNGCRLGDTVFVSVCFKNIDPFSCSKTETGKYDNATQDYCRRLHFIPNTSFVYWSGEVRTPYHALRLCAYAPPRPKTRKTSREIVVRRSRTSPLKHKVF